MKIYSEGEIIEKETGGEYLSIPLASNSNVFDSNVSNNEVFEINVFSNSNPNRLEHRREQCFY